MATSLPRYLDVASDDSSSSGTPAPTARLLSRLPRLPGPHSRPSPLLCPLAVGSAARARGMDLAHSTAEAGGGATPVASAKDVFGFQASEFVADLRLAGNACLGDAYDAFEASLEKWAGTRGHKVPAKQVDVLWKEAHTRLQYFMDRFELFALGTVFHVPAQLVGKPRSDAEASGPDEVAEEDVQAMEEELERIRSDIVATRAAARLLKHEVEALERELELTRDARPLAELAEQGGQAGVEEEARAVLDLARRLEQLLTVTEDLRSQGWPPTTEAQEDVVEAARRRVRQVGLQAEDASKVVARSRLPR